MGLPSKDGRQKFVCRFGDGTGAGGGEEIAEEEAQRREKPDSL